MRGTVLGFADERGVIVTEDDRRFGFTKANWRDEQPPLRGAVVDFVERDGGADEIYLALGAKPPRPGGVPGGAAGAGFGQGDGMRAFMDKLKAFPQLAVAAFVLIVFIFITYATVPASARGIDRELREYPTLLGLNGTLSPFRDDIRDRQEEMERGMDQLRSTPGGAPDEFRAKAVRTAERVGGAMNWLSWVVTFAMIFWLVPLAAIGVIALYLMGKRTFALISSIVLAVLCLFSGVYIWLLESAALNVATATMSGMSGSGDEMNRTARREIERAFELGVGGWLLVLCGIGLVVLLFVPRRKGEAAPVAG
ncbi:MAG: hypothetical protein QOD42_2575 [Sphingomonadales bacterium]|jgi:hypothetical protein|nr:hypothetical protein [Sphingomonadales bacterium]